MRIPRKLKKKLKKQGEFYFAMSSLGITAKYAAKSFRKVCINLNNIQ